MTAKECKTREQVINLAKQYTKEDLSFMSKHFAYNGEKVKNYVKNFCISNETICRVFCQKADKIIKSI